MLYEGYIQFYETIPLPRTEKYKLNEMKHSKAGLEEGGVQQKKKRENLCRNQR